MTELTVAQAIVEASDSLAIGLVIAAFIRGFLNK